MIMIVCIDICVVFFCNSYQDIIRRGYLIELKKTIVHCAAVCVGIIIWMFMFKNTEDYSRIVIGLTGLLSICVVFTARIIWKKILRIRISYNQELRKILVITESERAEEVVGNLMVPFHDYKLTAVVIYDDVKKPVKTIKTVPVLYGEEAIFSYIQNQIVDEVFLDLKKDQKQAEHLMNLFVNMGLTVHMMVAQFGTSMEQRRISTFGQYMVVSSSMKFISPRQLFCKRAMDICGALVGLLFAGAALVIFGPIIYRQSPGPIFFAQDRVGRNGRIFKMYKFRSMYLDAEKRKAELMKQNKMQGLMFKMDNDPRIIPIGHFIRKTSIDELPQFWNILKGEMSLVGTRPPTLDEYKQYEVHHRKRLAMKPGLTGMWQVSGRNDIVDFEEVVALDAKYIEEWTISMDIKILWKTVKIVLQRKGAS